jgi:hypothetical protein
MQYAVTADGSAWPVSEHEVDALIHRLDHTGVVQRDPGTRSIVWRSPSAVVAEALRRQRDEGMTVLEIPRELRGTVLETLHRWVGAADFSQRLADLRYAFHAELAGEAKAA